MLVILRLEHQRRQFAMGISITHIPQQADILPVIQVIDTPFGLLGTVASLFNSNHSHPLTTQAKITHHGRLKLWEVIWGLVVQFQDITGTKTSSTCIGTRTSRRALYLRPLILNREKLGETRTACLDTRRRHLLRQASQMMWCGGSLRNRRCIEKTALSSSGVVQDY